MKIRLPFRRYSWGIAANVPRHADPVRGRSVGLPNSRFTPSASVNCASMQDCVDPPVWFDTASREIGTRAWCCRYRTPGPSPTMERSKLGLLPSVQQFHRPGRRVGFKGGAHPSPIELRRSCEAVAGNEIVCLQMPNRRETSSREAGPQDEPECANSWASQGGRVASGGQ